jgi:GT2 family glycosyltransferase
MGPVSSPIRAGLSRAQMSHLDFTGLKVVIVNWCKPVDTIECIQSLVKNGIPADHILVIDNGSIDDSFNQIKKTCPEIEIHKMNENMGFTGGYNIGIELALKAGASKIFILNNDTIVDKDTVPILLASDWDVSVPKIYFYDNPKRIWSAGAHWRRFPPMIIMRGYQQLDNPRYDKLIPLEYMTACAIMVRREVIEHVGGFDEEFENYQEDYDFAYRVRAAGFNIGYIPNARVWHKESTSLGALSLQKWWYLGRNSVLFYRKDKRFPVWDLSFFLAWVTLRELLKMNLPQLIEFWRGVKIGKEWIKDEISRM